MPAEKTLLSIIELGGYPNFAPMYEQLGYQVKVAQQMRKALKYVKNLQPTAIVAEFNYQPDFRERVSNLESLFATLQSLPDMPNIVVFYELPHQAAVQKLQQRYDVFQALSYPVNEAQLRACLSLTQ